MPDPSLKPWSQRTLEQRKPELDRLVELLLEAERLELLHPSVGKTPIPWRRVGRRSSEEMLDGPACAAGDDLEGPHRGPGLAGLDEEDGLPCKVRARQLGHAQAGGEPRLPDERGFYLDAGKAPAWVGLTVVDLAFISRQRSFRPYVKSRGRPS
jgi:hypothetical protein